MKFTDKGLTKVDMFWNLTTELGTILDFAVCS